MTITGSPRYIAVPQEPTLGPMVRPSSAWRYSFGMLGAAPWPMVMPSSSSISTVHAMLSDSLSTSRTMLSNTAISGEPVAIISSS